MTTAFPRLEAPGGDHIAHLDFGTAFAASMCRDPGKMAVIDETGGLDWAAFGDLALRIGGRLAALGQGRHARVAALADNSAAYLALYAGTILAGACIVPLPTGARAETLSAMMRDCGADLLFASSRHADTARRINAGHVIAIEDIEAWAKAAPLTASEPVQPDDFFDLIYSSGTTGTPKGIIHDHRFRGRQLERMPVFGLNGDTTLLMSTPLHSNTTLVAALPVLAKGGTIVSMAKFDAVRFLQLSERHQVSHAMLVPVQYMRLLDTPEFEYFDLTSYRAKLSTSAPLPAPLKRAILDRWPGGLFELYGMTEGGVSTVLDCAAHPEKLDTVGRPVQGCDIRVIDEAGAELAPTEFGEIVGRAGAMMQGYLNAPEKTRDARWVSPEGFDFIRTGDMGRFDEDGFLHLLDRRKDMIISGGFNIYASDLERVLRDHPAVGDVAVIAVPSAKWGETPLALVVPRAGPQPAADDIRHWANDRLGKTQRLSAVEFRKTLPRSEIGKIEKRVLRAPYWERAET